MKRTASLVLLCVTVLQICSCASSTEIIVYTDMPCSQADVDEFCRAFGARTGEGLISGVKADAESFCNVTPHELSMTDCRVFKHKTTGASFVMIDNEVYEICPWLGGHGFVNAVPYGFDGEQKLLVASSSGCGLHRSEISVFNVRTKEYTTLFSTADTENPGVDLIVRAYMPVFSSREPDPASDTVYEVCFADIKTDGENSCKLSYYVTGVAGRIVVKSGEAVFEPDPKAESCFVNERRIQHNCLNFLSYYH